GRLERREIRRICEMDRCASGEAENVTRGVQQTIAGCAGATAGKRRRSWREHPVGALCGVLRGTIPVDVRVAEFTGPAGSYHHRKSSASGDDAAGRLSTG